MKRTCPCERMKNSRSGNQSCNRSLQEGELKLSDNAARPCFLICAIGYQAWVKKPNLFAGVTVERKGISDETFMAGEGAAVCARESLTARLKSDAIRPRAVSLGRLCAPCYCAAP